MIVFKTFLKVLNKCKIPIIMYTVMLIIFGSINFKTSDNSTNFIATKPDVLIINNDVNEGITKNLIDYISKSSNIKNIENDTEKINDALFYRDINYIIVIPKNYRNDFLNKKNPKIEIKNTGNYQASFAQMQLERYIKVANSYNYFNNSEQKIIDNINNTLNKQIKVELTSKVDADKLSKVTFFYNFANYSILAGCVYVICLVLASFKEEHIKKRTIVSSINYKKYNLYLILSNSLFALVLWLFYVILSIILLGDIIFTKYGLIYTINSFIFTIFALTIAFLIGNMVINKNIINGIINVIALGSSFLCGAFVPVDLLPKFVLKIAHILPSYYYINTNERLKNIDTFTFEKLQPILMNMAIIILFSVLMIILVNIVTNKNRKVN